MNKRYRSLKSELEQWHDGDVAMYKLACVLGLIECDTNRDTFREHKHLFWTDTPVGEMLYKTFGNLCEVGLLESDTDKEKYRWKHSGVDAQL